MKLSIIIVNWNTCELLMRCLDTVFAQSFSEVFEVVLVDNASKDDSVEKVKFQFPQVKVIVSHENIGFARGNNLAIHEAKGDYILLLNPDTEVMPEALNYLVQFLDKHRNAGAAGSSLLNPDHTPQTSCYPFPTLAREFWRMFHLDNIYPLGVYNTTGWDLQQYRKVDVIQGASLLLRKVALDQVGVLDDDYFMYTEEVDLCYRLHKAGWSLYWVPESRVIHYGGQSTQQAAVDMFLQLYQSKILFFRKHYSSSTATLYKSILWVASIFRILVSWIAYFEKSPQKEIHLTLAQHYRKLLSALPGM